MIIKANETLKDAALSANSTDINYPLSNLLNSLLTKSYRTDSNTTATIVFDAGSAVTVNSIDIANHNISSGVTTFKIQGNATDAWGAPSVDETVTWASGVINKDFTGGSYRYWRLHIIDAGNSDGYIKLGRVFGSDNFTMPGLNPTFSHKRMSNSLKTTTVSGQSYQDVRYFNSIISVRLSKITHAQKADIITEFETIDIGKPFFITFDETSLDIGTLYVTFDSDAYNFNILRNASFYETSMSFVEEI